MGVKWEVMAKTGTYKDRDGQEKTRWAKCGAVFETDKGLSMRLETIPVGEWNGWLSLFEPREKGTTAPTRSRKNDDDVDRDIPFIENATDSGHRVHGSMKRARHGQ